MIKHGIYQIRAKPHHRAPVTEPVRLILAQLTARGRGSNLPKAYYGMDHLTVQGKYTVELFIQADTMVMDLFAKLPIAIQPTVAHSRPYDEAHAAKQDTVTKVVFASRNAYAELMPPGGTGEHVGVLPVRVRLEGHDTGPCPSNIPDAANVILRDCSSTGDQSPLEILCAGMREIQSAMMGRYYAYLDFQARVAKGYRPFPAQWVGWYPENSPLWKDLPHSQKPVVYENNQWLISPGALVLFRKEMQSLLGFISADTTEAASLPEGG